MSKLTIVDQVKENKDLLLSMTTHAELRAWAVEAGFDSAAAFPRFKLALTYIGLDYDHIKKKTIESSYTQAQEERKKLLSGEANGDAFLKLADELGGNVWLKGNIKRIYLDRGADLDKLATVKTYIFLRENGTFGVNCTITCPGKAQSWIKEQQNEIEDSLQQEVDELVKTEPVQKPEQAQVQGPVLKPQEAIPEQTKKADPIVSPSLKEKPVKQTPVYKVGSLYAHESFGTGKCLQVEETKVVIEFPGHGTKGMLIAFARLVEVAA